MQERSPGIRHLSASPLAPFCSCCCLTATSRRSQPVTVDAHLTSVNAAEEAYPDRFPSLLSAFVLGAILARLPRQEPRRHDYKHIYYSRSRTTLNIYSLHAKAGVDMRGKSYLARCIDCLCKGCRLLRRVVADGGKADEQTPKFRLRTI